MTDAATDGLTFYLVGGAVRDALLGEPVKDRDYVVVGTTPDEMLARGFRPVGKDFPVFLHPETHDEYALARRERKTSPGYHGFAVHAGPEVTLEEDLGRRDLTINAIARSEPGALVDPFGGQADAAARVLRHVTEAFSEDPVRVLRLARFAARLPDFSVHPDTNLLARQMVEAGELHALVAERVWQELRGALLTARPSRFLTVLRECGALKVVLPEVDALFGVPQTAEYHPEVDTGVHVGMVLDQAAAMGLEETARFACLVHDLGKALTSEDELPSHRGHEASGLTPLRALCKRLRVPKNHQRLAERVCEHHLRCHRALELRPGKVLKLIELCDGLRNPDQFEQFLGACEADARGRGGGLDRKPYPQRRFLTAALAAARGVSTAPMREAGLEGLALANALRQARIAAIKALPRPDGRSGAGSDPLGV